jgi:glycosyltransferase involved in cell wall biosynthesis
VRVLQICSGNLYGGVETTMLALARIGFDSTKVKFDFTVCFEGRFSSELRSCGAQVQNLGAVRIRNPISVMKARETLRDLLTSFRYDAAICHSSWSHAIFGPVVRASGVPLLFWLHAAPSGRHWLEQWASRTRPDKVICCSQFSADLSWKLFPGISGDVVYPPMALPPRNRAESLRLETRAEFQTPPKSVVIIQVSRMEAGKGQLRLIEALKHMQDIPDWVCWFVGGPQRAAESVYMRELEAAAQDSGINDRVRFAGHRSDVPRLLQAADLFCQPNSSPEGFGQVFVEALWAGIPVVTSAIGGGSEVLDSTCGLLIPPDDVTALTSALRRLVTDSSLRARMGEAAPVRAHQLCEPSRQFARLEEVIRETVFQESTA